ncbi:putative HD superfamily hydrolase involved in NAD metabolism [Paenibacillus cellulosilyticus]|uniref:bis(5'-nucleosyl)-tetraphosphatase (symmetrical) n=1 Tax=Paenibacillus cellulosilyticus TaxID=375489 RepID=A0A2V2YPR3_9BACL|nr:bis(5'-nucleosyl)-tetraphosphatase (symmetrical) YqeK [Paenibacillus cellulosilyticus]PWV98416.1 putative HD superfamily hydrolase involved in NAD metabolism [Paenibacillus cellulosilyticus]QKS43263.1 HD domain-containing protein [Paenibacillus cellulosilyticus]
MNREEMIESVKAEMPERRWLHVQGVMATSVELANRFGADPVRAELAAILHDVTKYWPTARMEQIIREEQLPQELLDYDKELWHAHVGAFIAERDYGVTDPEILDAIRYHTSGRVGMTLLEKIVCLADYMEPSRDFPGVNKIRSEAEHSVEKALLTGFDGTITFLIEKGKRIFPLTVLARNDMVRQVNGG